MTHLDDDHFHDHCGVCGVFGHPEAAKLAYLGLYALQHRGQESAGIVSSDGAALHLEKGMGLVQEIFQPQVLARLPGTAAVGHTRYSTAGDTSLVNAQPIVIDCNKGKLALAHNGNLTNAGKLRRTLEHRGSIFQTTSDTEVIVHLVARSAAHNLQGALGDALNQVEGAYSLLVLTRDELYAIRDPRGFRPLCLGRLGDAWLVASETCAFDLIGAEYVREIEPGELVRISRSGVESLRFAPPKPHQFCVFEHVYFARPDSLVFGRPVDHSREMLGRLLAREQPADADLVVPVPDSGVPAAIGYCARIRLALPHGPDPQSLHRPHLHRARAVHPRFRREAQAQSRAHAARRQARRPGGRLHRPRHHQPQDRAHGARGRRHRSAHAHQLPAHGFALLLRHRYAHARGVAGLGRFRIRPRLPEGGRPDLSGAARTLEEIRLFLDADSVGYLSLESLRRAVDDTTGSFCTSCYTGIYVRENVQLEVAVPAGAPVPESDGPRRQARAEGKIRER